MPEIRSRQGVRSPVSPQHGPPRSAGRLSKAGSLAAHEVGLRILTSSASS